MIHLKQPTISWGPKLKKKHQRTCFWQRKKNTPLLLSSKLNEVVEKTHCVYKRTMYILKKTFKYSSSQAFKCSFLEVIYRSELLKRNVLKWRQMSKGSLRQGISNKTTSELNFNWWEGYVKHAIFLCKISHKGSEDERELYHLWTGNVA